MNKNLFLLILIVGFILSCSTSQVENKYAKISIIPKPLEVKVGKNDAHIDKNTAIVFDADNKDLQVAAKQLNAFFTKHYQFELPVNTSAKNSIQLKIQEISNQPEEYILTSGSEEISIVANQLSGILHGIQSLKQLIYPAQELSNGKIKVPGLSINDYPAYSWRGMHLDVSRHFYDKNEVIKILNAMATAKLNIFHWHLTDDQGWRIEIKKYPKLTSEGAYRDSMIVGHMADYPPKYNVKRYGGYYTQEDIKEVVQHAANLGITIVPEIEMPGHAVAALQAYPEYSCKGSDVPAFSEWGVSEHVFCAGKDQTFDFLQDIISEVIELFPGPYIHVGGDECPKTKWKKCPKCQSRMAAHKLHDEMELQSYFIKRMEKFIRSKGKTLIGWDEILEGGLADGTMVMSWQGEKGGTEAALQGHDVVMSPNDKVYLDHYQSNFYEPLAIAGLTTPKEIYQWTPTPKELPNDKKKFIKGAQANVWTEYITSKEHLEYMIFPRLIALSEMLWAGDERKDFADFSKRMNEMYPRLDALNINYRIPYPDNLLPYKIFSKQNTELSLTNGIPASSILYTLNGDDPLTKGIKYEKPIQLDLKTDLVLKAVTLMPSNRHSEVISVDLRYREPANSVTADTKPDLKYQLYKGHFSSTREISGEKTTGTIESPKIPDTSPELHFGIKYTGYISVPKDGKYKFSLEANDAASLYIHDELVIDIDGFSYGKQIDGEMFLRKGLHPFKLNYMQAKYGKMLNLKAIFTENDENIKLSYFH